MAFSAPRKALFSRVEPTEESSLRKHFLRSALASITATETIFGVFGARAILSIKCGPAIG